MESTSIPIPAPRIIPRSEPQISGFQRKMSPINTLNPFAHRSSSKKGSSSQIKPNQLESLLASKVKQERSLNGNGNGVVSGTGSGSLSSITALELSTGSSSLFTNEDVAKLQIGNGISKNLIGSPTDKFTFTSPRLRQIRRSSSRLSSSCLPKPQSKQDLGKLTLVLDIDETLIHSRMNEQMRPSYTNAFSTKSSNAGVGPKCEDFELVLGDGEKIMVNKRPGVDEFLKHVSERYEVVAYTAGLKQYAEPLLKMLDPEGKIFRYKLYRDSCLFTGGYYVKDLEKVNRDLTRCILVDNNVISFLPQLSNGIPISSFYDDPADDALKVLQNFLDKLDSEVDVRPMLDNSFNLLKALGRQRDEILG